MIQEKVITMAKKFKMKSTAKKKPEQKKSEKPGEAKKMTFKPVSEEKKVEEKSAEQKNVVKKDEKQPPKKVESTKDNRKDKKRDEELKVKMAYPKGTAGTWQERFEGILNDILNRMERLENSHNTLSDEISEIRENVNELETNIHELTALYDAISAQYNPFIDLTPQERRVIGGETIQVEATSEESTSIESELPENLSDELSLEAEPMEEELAPAESFEELAPPQAETPMLQPRGGYILPDIPENSLSHMTAIKWTEFMLEKVGANNIRKLLEYYRDMRWISDRVMNKILHQVLGLNTESIEAEYDTWKMSTDDHMKTLVFIEKIKGGDVGTIHAEEVQDWADDIKRG